MRTTLNISDDVLHAAKDRARREKRTVGEVLSELARSALTASPSSPQEGEPPAHFGLRPFPRRGIIVTNELIDRLREPDAC